MRRYYFHVCDGTQDIDELGHDLPDDREAGARRFAIAAACSATTPTSCLPTRIYA